MWIYEPVSWGELIAEAMCEAGDEGPIIACTLTDDMLNLEFCNGYGRKEGKPFTAWTERRVYFPVCYDGSEWVGSVPRNPCDEATRHQGGD